MRCSLNGCTWLQIPFMPFCIWSLHWKNWTWELLLPLHVCVSKLKCREASYLVYSPFWEQQKSLYAAQHTKQGKVRRASVFSLALGVCYKLSESPESTMTGLHLHQCGSRSECYSHKFRGFGFWSPSLWSQVFHIWLRLENKPVCV